MQTILLSKYFTLKKVRVGEIMFLKYLSCCTLEWNVFLFLLLSIIWCLAQRNAKLSVSLWPLWRGGCWSWGHTLLTKWVYILSSSVWQPDGPEKHPGMMRFVSLSGYAFPSHPGLCYPSDPQAALPTALTEPRWLPEVVFGYTDEKLGQRASCFCQQSHLWGKLLHWGNLDFPGTWNYIIYMSAKATCCWVLVLSCHAFHFSFVIISTAIHLFFHSLPVIVFQSWWNKAHSLIKVHSCLQSGRKCGLSIGYDRTPKPLLKRG